MLYGITIALTKVTIFSEKIAWWSGQTGNKLISLQRVEKSTMNQMLMELVLINFSSNINARDVTFYILIKQNSLPSIERNCNRVVKNIVQRNKPQQKHAHTRTITTNIFKIVKLFLILHLFYKLKPYSRNQQVGLEK